MVAVTEQKNEGQKRKRDKRGRKEGTGRETCRRTSFQQRSLLGILMPLSNPSLPGKLKVDGEADAKKVSMKQFTVSQAFLALLNFYLLHLRNLYCIRNLLSNTDNCDLPSIWFLSTSAFLYMFLTFIICVCPTELQQTAPHTHCDQSSSRFKSLHMITLRPITLWLLLMYINLCANIFPKNIFKTYHPFRELLKSTAIWRASKCGIF